MNTVEKIKVSNQGDHWVCPCGNNTMGTGFDTCTTSGTFIEPSTYWEGYYACLGCGRIIDQQTRIIIGKTNDLSSFNL